MIRITTLFLLLFLLFIEACNQGYIVNMKEPTSHPEGRNLFVSKCNACHQLYNPVTYSAAEWDSILVPMKDKAKLKDAQRDAIYKWILEIKRYSSKSADLN